MKKGPRIISLILIMLMMMPVPFAFGETGAASFAVAENEAQAEAVTEAAEEDPESAEEAVSEEAVSGSGTTAVTVADSIEDLLSESETADNDPFFTIDTGKKTLTEELATEEVSSDIEDILKGGGSSADRQEAVAETLEESGYYTVQESGNRKVDVTSNFAFQRLSLKADKTEEIEAYGAVSAVYYDGRYLLSYDSEEATRNAYFALAEKYGEKAVLIDIPIATESVGWGSAYMGLDTEQVKAAKGSAVTVAVIDTGISGSHPVFDDTKIVYPYDFINGQSGIGTDETGHGTAVAGVIAESTASNVRLMPLKVLGTKGGSMLTALYAAQYADEHGADIINMSFGGYVASDNISRYESFFNKINALMICSSANDGKNMDEDGVNLLPGEFKSTLCVSSINMKGERSYFSNYGSAVDFTAPGQNLMLAQPGGVYRENSGTSFSAPYISAFAALIKAENPGFGKAQIKSELIKRSVDLGEAGKDAGFGYGCPVFVAGDQGSGFRMVINYSDTMRYTGSAVTQSFSVISDDLTVLKAGTDYDVRYQNNVNAGTAVAVITGKGDHAGRTSTIKFRILPLKGITVSLSASSYVYNGKKKTPAVTVKYGSKVLKKDKDYTVVYPDGRVKPGTYTIKVTAKGNYSGSSSKSYKIKKPKTKTDLPSVKIKDPEAGKKSLTVRWKKVSKKNRKKIAGIQIQVKGPGINKIYKTGKGKTSAVIKKLKSNKKYKVRVRAYRINGYYRHYSKWSKYKTVKTG